MRYCYLLTLYNEYVTIRINHITHVYLGECIMNIRILSCICALSLYGLSFHAAAPDNGTLITTEQWAAFPLEYCTTPRQKFECLKGRQLAKKLSEERQQAIANKLQANQQQSAAEIEMPPHSDAPISAREVAILRILQK